MDRSACSLQNVCVFVCQCTKSELILRNATHYCSFQNASLSTASSASWPKQPPVPTTKPPNEFDSLGLRLRSRSYGDKEFTTDSLLRGLGKESEEVGVSHHAHAHTHHHYHQPGKCCGPQTWSVMSHCHHAGIE